MFPNTEIFLPALEKLQILLSFVVYNQAELQRQTGVEDQARLIVGGGVPAHENGPGIQTSAILSQVNFCHSFSIKAKESIQVLEAKAIRNLIVFLRRCIDVIKFLKMISFEGEDKGPWPCVVKF